MRVPAIDGDGVRLRALGPDHLDDLLTAYNDPEIRHFLPALPVPFTRPHAETYLNDVVPAMFAAGGGFWAVTDPGTGRLVGGIGLDRTVIERGQSELGYWTAPWARGRGVATAAVRALSDHAFRHGLSRLELLTHWENSASQRVALAAGFTREGVRRGLIANRDGGRDELLAYARLDGDPAGPAERLLPDLPGGELSDGVITLRPLGPDDLEAYAELHSLEEVVATTVPPVPPSRSDMERRCDRSQAHWLDGRRAELMIFDAATGEPAGEIGLYYQEPRTAQAMIGYGMLPAWRGRGYPTRAAQLIALWAFAETGIARLIAGALPSNVASHRVLEKAGFTREAYLRSRLPGPDGRRADDVQFVLLPEDLLSQTLDGNA